MKTGRQQALSGWIDTGGRLGEDLICPIEGTAYRLINPNKLGEIYLMSEYTAPMEFIDLAAQQN